MSTLFETEPVEKSPSITALAPWFGSNRMLGKHVGEELRGCKWVGVPFAGGMAELLHIKAPTVLVSDLHRHVINLAMVTADRQLGPKLYRRLRRKPLHEYQHLTDRNASIACEPVTDIPNIDAAEYYFAAVWMGRSARAGQKDEFTGGPCIRWTGNGGSSATRYRSATTGIRAWRSVFQRCDFVVMDAFDFLDRTNDEDGNGLYPDPPFLGPGGRYKHNCGKTEAEQVAWHTRLRDALARFTKTRIVCRFYDHPLIRELYPEPRWTWRHLKGRDQANNGEKAEVLLINGESYA